MPWLIAGRVGWKMHKWLFGCVLQKVLALNATSNTSWCWAHRHVSWRYVNFTVGHYDGFAVFCFFSPRSPVIGICNNEFDWGVSLAGWSGARNARHLPDFPIFCTCIHMLPSKFHKFGHCGALRTIPQPAQHRYRISPGPIPPLQHLESAQSLDGAYCYWWNFGLFLSSKKTRNVNLLSFEQMSS